MSEINEKIKNVKEKLPEVGQKTKDIFAIEKVSQGAKAGADKIKETVENITLKKEIKKKKEDSADFDTADRNSLSEDAIFSEANIKLNLNTVIEGTYKGEAVIGGKNKLFVGEKEISSLNCESYENPDNLECVIQTKELFEMFKKKAKNPLDKMIKDNYISVLWRTGEKSVLCVDQVKKAMIIKLLS